MVEVFPVKYSLWDSLFISVFYCRIPTKGVWASLRNSGESWKEECPWTKRGGGVPPGDYHAGIFGSWGSAYWRQAHEWTGTHVVIKNFQIEISTVESFVFTDFFIKIKKIGFLWFKSEFFYFLLDIAVKKKFQWSPQSPKHCN